MNAAKVFIQGSNGDQLHYHLLITTCSLTHYDEGIELEALRLKSGVPYSNPSNFSSSSLVTNGCHPGPQNISASKCLKAIQWTELINGSLC